MICIYTFLALTALTPPQSTQDRLAPLSLLTQEQLIERIPEHFPEAKLIIVTKPSENEKDDQALYEAYWMTQKFKPYPGIYIAAEKKLPGQFAERKWSDKHILIVDPTTSRDVIFHIILHFLLPEAAERQKIADEVVELQKAGKESEKKLIEARLKLFVKDIEILTDLYLLENADSFRWSETESASIAARLKHQVTRLEREFQFLKATAQKLEVSTDAGAAFIEKLKSKLPKDQPK